MNFSKLFIAGCGDIGIRTARLALAEGIAVTAMSRSGERAATLTGNGAEVITGNLDVPESLPLLTTAGAALIYFVPPPGGGVVDSRVSTFLSAIPPGAEPLRIVYVSTTAVYGACGAELIDETREPAPANHTGRRRYDAEQQFALWAAARQVPLIILRVSGIYGPGRIPMQRILDREPLLSESEAGYTNRIHADDLAQVCLAALKLGEDGDIFNVSDGESSRMTDYFNTITDLMNLPRLPQVSLAEARTALSPLMYSYMTESRRIDNRKMLAKLKIKLQYPTMRDGLQASL
jgi:NAD dependent epimerase/dehydratase family enzyme